MLNCSDTNKGSRRPWLERLVVGAVSAAALALCASGCVARADYDVEPVYAYPTVAVEAPPAYTSYPRYYYNGRYAYLVGDQWYYDSPNGWVMFQSEPRVLAERRVHIHRAEPRRHRHRQERPRYYEERRAPAYPQAPVERGRRYYPN